MGSKLKIIIPIVPKSQNELNRIHWSKRYKYGKKLEHDVWSYCLKAKQEQHIIWKKFTKVEITFVWADNRRRDIDNAIGGSKKMLDALVLSGLIEDDNYKAADITYKMKKGEKNHTEIVLS